MLKLYLKYYKPYRKIFWSVVIGSCITSLLDLLFPILVRKMLDKELSGGDLTVIAKLLWDAIKNKIFNVLYIKTLPLSVQ